VVLLGQGEVALAGGVFWVEFQGLGKDGQALMEAFFPGRGSGPGGVTRGSGPVPGPARLRD